MEPAEEATNQTQQIDDISFPTAEIAKECEEDTEYSLEVTEGDMNQHQKMENATFLKAKEYEALDNNVNENSEMNWEPVEEEEEEEEEDENKMPMSGIYGLLENNENENSQEEVDEEEDQTEENEEINILEAEETEALENSENEGHEMDQELAEEKEEEEEEEEDMLQQIEQLNMRIAEECNGIRQARVRMVELLEQMMLLQDILLRCNGGAPGG